MSPPCVRAIVSVQVPQHLWLFSLPLCGIDIMHGGPSSHCLPHGGPRHVLELSCGAVDPHPSKEQRWLWLSACQCPAGLIVRQFKGRCMRWEGTGAMAL